MDSHHFKAVGLLDIPDEMPNLKRLSERNPATNREKRIRPGPRILRRIRNAHEHTDIPVEGTEENYFSNALFEAWHLGQWYTEAVILSRCEYLETISKPVAKIMVVRKDDIGLLVTPILTFPRQGLTGVGIWCIPLRDDRFLRVRRRARMWFRKQQCPCQPVCLVPKRRQTAMCLPSPQIYTYPYKPVKGEGTFEIVS